MKINMTRGQITWLTSNILDRNIERKRVIITFFIIVALKNGFDQLNSRPWALHCYKKRIFSIGLGITIKDLIRHGHKHVLTSVFGIQNKDRNQWFITLKQTTDIKCTFFSKNRIEPDYQSGNFYVFNLRSWRAMKF